MKLVINRCYGGFGLSAEAIELYKQICRDNGEVLSSDNYNDAKRLSRNDPYLVEVVEKLGASASADTAKLVIKEIPDEYGQFGAWDIAEYDGRETVKLDKMKLEMGKSIEKLQAENEQLCAKYERLRIENEQLRYTYETDTNRLFTAFAIVTILAIAQNIHLEFFYK